MDIIRIETPTPFAVGPVNSFLLKGDVLSIVDVGTNYPDAQEVMESKLREFGYAVTDIEQVILTHHHPDHIGLTDIFTNASVIGHPYNDVWLSRSQPFFDYQVAFYKQQLIEEGVPGEHDRIVDKMVREAAYMGTKVLTTKLNDGETVPGHPNLKAVETLGHAQSHLIFVDEKEGFALGGDLLLKSVASNPLIEPSLQIDEPRAKAQLQYNDSLRTLQSFHLQTIYPGHGDIFDNPNPLIEERLEKQKQRAMNVLSLIEGNESLFMINQKVFPKKFASQLGLTLSMTLGQLDYLESIQAITSRKTEEGVILYDKA